MKRLHVNVAVTDLDNSIRFYTSLFDEKPTVLKEDYAKWMLDDPRINFAITTRAVRKGIDHLGIQVESTGELDEVHSRLKAAGAPMIEQGETTCCYARSEKNWIFDPEGIPWETFFSKGESPVYGSNSELIEPGTACCARPDHNELESGVPSYSDGIQKETNEPGCCP